MEGSLPGDQGCHITVLHSGQDRPCSAASLKHCFFECLQTKDAGSWVLGMVQKYVINVVNKAKFVIQNFYFQTYTYKFAEILWSFISNRVEDFDAYAKLYC